MQFCRCIYQSWQKTRKLLTPTWKKLNARSNLQETLASEIFASLQTADFKVDKITPDLKEFLETCSASWGSTAMVEDSFQRLRSAEQSVPTKRLSGSQAWAVPIEKSVLSSVYDFEELHGDECPTLQADDKLVSSAFFHLRVREASMPELPRGIQYLYLLSLVFV